MSLNAAILRETLERATKENGGTRALGLAFYKRLFSKYPQVKPLFNTPAEEQHKKLMASVGAIVTSVENTDKLLPYLRAMAIRHLKYGTESAHYPAVAENLVAVLAEHLSKEGEWTEEHAKAWKDALDVVNSVMVEAAENPEKYKDEMESNGYLPDGFRTGDKEPWLMREKSTR